ncbi:hypothetical protein CK203_053943 [Vitis vinifera]|uniref:Uncharacterized protein n=1 Tax=Vitis vinifera TaxID=29760 RepID=A0A438H8A9_VITVI|nr:hypothetical protein CK203_053943 [Vitis vinifera]
MSLTGRRERVLGLVGPVAAEGGDLNGEGISSPRARAQLPEVEKGSGDADLLVRGKRLRFSAASPSEASVVPKSGSLTDEALRDEASRWQQWGDGPRGGRDPRVVEGRGDEFEILLQDLEGRGCRWDDSCLARFSKFLGFLTEGFEGEILNLLLRNKRRREQNIKKDISGSTKFDRELKKLEWSINYKGRGKEKSLVRDGGDRISKP